MGMASSTGRFLTRQINKIRSSILAKNFLVHMANFGSQMVVQLLYFLIIAAVIGVAGYGVFASLLVISIIGMIVVGLGCETTMIKNVAVDRSKFNDYLGHCLSSSLVTLPLVSAVVIPVALYFYTDHMSWQAIILIVMADLAFTKLFNIGNHAFMAMDRAGYMLFLSLGASLTRMAALGVATLFTDQLTLDQWAVWYCAGQALWGVVCLVTTIAVLGLPNWFMAPREWGLGIQFTVDQGAQAGFKDIDKPAVLQAIGPEATGVYTVAFRLAEAANTPVRALLYAIYTRFFKLAGDGRQRSVGFAFKVVPVAFGLAGAIGVGIIIVSMIMPGVIGYFFGADKGAEFEPAMGYLRLLAPYPLLLALTFIGMDVLRATDRQGLRLVLMLTSALVVVPVCFFGAQWLGIIGAILGRVVVQLAAAVTAWTIIVFGHRDDAAAERAAQTASAAVADE